MRLLNLLTISICGCLMLCAMVISRAQEGASGGGGLGGFSGPGGEGLGETVQGQREYEVKHADGSSEAGQYKIYYTYTLAPGWAKPRRLLGVSEQMGGGVSYLATRSGQAKQSGLGASGGMRAQSLPAGGIVMAALVVAKAEGDTRSRVIVGQLQPPASFDMGGMDGGMGMAGGGMGGMPGMAMGSGGGGMMGGGMGGMGDARVMGGMMGGSGMVGGMMIPDGVGNLVIVPLEECRIPTYGRTSSEPRLTVAQLKNLADLVRIDCWIEEELATLREVRQDAEKFKAAESSLKELLSKEYELQLSKQREDIERMNEKLKALQGELARRASAQDRVVEVQLGQLILEAQGLIGERP